MITPIIYSHSNIYKHDILEKLCSPTKNTANLDFLKSHFKSQLEFLSQKSCISNLKS